MLLYKYRSLDNWEYFLDILARQRLFAASYLVLNDPLEGYYEYATNAEVSKEYDEKICRATKELLICSLSAEGRSTLMWSYYGGGHTGVAIGIKAPRSRSGRRVMKVYYDNIITLNSLDRRSVRDTAVTILSKKLDSWRHEKEYRIFASKPFIRVTIEEILLGCRISREHESLIKSLVKSMRPGVKVKKLRTAELVADYGPQR